MQQNCSLTHAQTLLQKQSTRRKLHQCHPVMNLSPDGLEQGLTQGLCCCHYQDWIKGVYDIPNSAQTGRRKTYAQKLLQGFDCITKSLQLFYKDGTKQLHKHKTCSWLWRLFKIRPNMCFCRFQQWNSYNFWHTSWHSPKNIWHSEKHFRPQWYT